MKRTYNKEQSQYLVARANVQVLEDEEKQLEQKYITDHAIVNPDGSIPGRIYCIDDQTIFDQVNVDFSEQPESKEFYSRFYVAQSLLKASESKLVKYGLEIIPVSMQKEKSTLEESAKTNYTTRLKLIELVMKLDTRTVA